MSSLRKCRECGKEAHSTENLELFQKGKKSKYGRENICLDCVRLKNLTWSRNNAEAKKEAQDKWRCKNKYNISYEEYKEIMDSAVECEVCGSTSKLVYDHDHETHLFRGILCSDCNRSIGQLGDTLESLERATEYLRKHYD